jgi:uroporphyrinogen decarboxylase
VRGVERVLTALRRKQPDRVPTFEWEIDDQVISALIPGGDLFDFIEWADLDGIAIFADEKKEFLDEATYIDEWGVTKRKTVEYYPFPVDEPLKDPADLGRLMIPNAHAGWHFETLNKAVNRFKGTRAIIFRAQDAFSIPRYLRGVERLMMDFILHPELVFNLVAIAVEYNSALARRAIELGADAIFMSDDYADNRGPMMSPGHFRKFLLPGLAQVVDAIHQAGGYAIKHTDGNVRPILDDLIDVGIDCLDPLDPLGGMDLREIKPQYGHRVCLKGNVNIGGHLSLGTPKQVQDETLACLRAGMEGGGYILSTSNSVMSCVKPDNYMAMLDTLRKFGGYKELK